MKRSIINIALSIIAAAAMLVSCTDFLQETPKTFNSPNNYYTTADEIQAAVNGCYGYGTAQGLPSMFVGMIGVGMNGHVFIEGLTGYSDRLSNTNFKEMAFLLPLDQTIDGYNQNFWKGYYLSIENCNSTIQGIESCTIEESKLSTANKNAMLAEVYFLRAYYYYRLVTLFGPVPYKTTVTSGTDGMAIPADSEKTVFEGIVSDLETAEALTKDSAWTRKDGHVSKGAIKSLLAKVYLTMGGYPVQDASYYAKAYDKAKEVVTSGAYALGTYDDLKDQSKENSGEIIFAIQRNAESASNPLGVLCLPKSNPRACSDDNDAGAFTPCTSFIESFAADDTRGVLFFRNTFNAYDNGGASLGYTFTTPRRYVNKYYDGTGLDDNQYGLDYILLRYADLELVLAEAKVMADGGTTTDADAIAAYQEVHGRAVPGSTAPANLDFDTVFKERVWELCYENQTWFDMVRTRKAFDPATKTVVNLIGYLAPGHANAGSGAFTLTDIYLPYPVREKRLNPNLKR